MTTSRAAAGNAYWANGMRGSGAMHGFPEIIVTIPVLGIDASHPRVSPVIGRMGLGDEIAGVETLDMG